MTAAAFLCADRARGEEPLRPARWRPAHRSLQPEASGVRYSLRIIATIRIGDERKAPIGPHIQVQNRSERRTARLLISIRRPMIVGVMYWPSANTTSMNRPAGTRPEPRFGADTTPTTIRTTIIKNGPTIGMKLSVAAKAPK